MKRKFLQDLFKGLDIPKETIDAILDENGSDVEAEKAKTKELQEEISTLKKVDGEALLQEIAELKESVGAKEESLKQAISEKEDLTSQVEKVTKELTHTHQVDMYLLNAKPKNLKAMKALISQDKLKEVEFDEDGKSTALDEIISSVVKENGYLFGEDNEYSPRGGQPAGTQVSMNEAILQGIQGQGKNN